MTIVITAKREGFRRAGIAHSSKPTRYADDFFSEEQLKAMLKEPQLTLAHVEDEFDQVQESFNESSAQAALSETSNSTQDPQSQASETGSTSVDDGVDAALAVNSTSDQGGPAAGGNVGDVAGSAGAVVSSVVTPADGGAEPGQVSETQAKPEKPKAKPKDGAK
ncbi:HI1506-related protein [Pseudomonas sp. NPDC087346]|uniref:HI1506-related protein n=1 Tax=Pseudomonas sp. NPDC087346 TaxID=3364438 RepID=UPI00381DAD00